MMKSDSSMMRRFFLRMNVVCQEEYVTFAGFSKIYCREKINTLNIAEYGKVTQP